MAFTRANGVARLLVSVLDIEFVPDVVKWTYRGQIFNLEIEFEDTDLFAEALAGTDVDMHKGDDSSGAKEAPVDDVGRELSNGWGSVSQTPGDGTAPSSSVPMNTEIWVV